MSFLSVALLVMFMSSLSILFLTPLAEKFGLVDVPNQRKLHQGHIPLIGGLSIYIGLAVGILLFAAPGNGYVTYMVCSSLIVVLGVMDDSWDISPLVRLVVQALVAFIMIVGAGLYISNVGDLFGQGDLYIGYGGVLLTIVAVLAGINAFNMIDGIDGLLGINSMITFLGLGLLFFLKGDVNSLYMSLFMVVALIPYLAVNMGIVKVRKIFMGDTGSMLIGFTVVWLLVKGSQGAEPAFSTSTALWLVAFPVMDMVRVMLCRMRDGKPVFKADRTHLHHLLLLRYANRYLVLVKICSLSLLFVLTGVLLPMFGWSESAIFLLFLASFSVYVVSLARMGKKWISRSQRV